MKNAIIVTPGNNAQYNIYLVFIIHQIRQFTNIDIHILSLNSTKMVASLYNIIKTKYKNIFFTNVDKQASILHLNQVTTNRFSIMTFLRLCVPLIDSFAKYDKILHLDTDIIINKNFDDIFNYDMGDNYLGMCIDPVINNDFEHQYIKSLNIKLMREKIKTQDIFDKYFNSGVILFNNALLRKDILNHALLRNDHTTTDIYIKLIYVIDLFFKYNFELVDQDILNIVFANQIFELNSIYNYSAVKDYQKPEIDPNDVVFIHYFGIPAKNEFNKLLFQKMQSICKLYLIQQ